MLHAVIFCHKFLLSAVITT